MAHLTDEQIDRFRRRVLAMREQMDALLTQTADATRPVDLDLPIGRLTRMDAIQLQGMAEMNRRQLEIRRRQVDVALATFEEGTFGLCRNCKQPIGLERLEALPESPFCIECQESFESGR